MFRSLMNSRFVVFLSVIKSVYPEIKTALFIFASQGMMVFLRHWKIPFHPERVFGGNPGVEQHVCLCGDLQTSLCKLLILLSLTKVGLTLKGWG